MFLKERINLSKLSSMRQEMSRYQRLQGLQVTGRMKDDGKEIESSLEVYMMMESAG